MSDRQQYLYRIQPARPEMLSAGPDDREVGIIGEHFAYLQGLVGDGVVILAGRTLTTDTKSFGIVIFQAGSMEEAESIMHGDPAVRHGVMLAELYPYRIALMAGDIVK